MSLIKNYSVFAPNYPVAAEYVAKGTPLYFTNGGLLPIVAGLGPIIGIAGGNFYVSYEDGKPYSVVGGEEYGPGALKVEVSVGLLEVEI